MLILYATGHLQIWHLCVVGALSGTFQAFQWPAYQAAISTMMPKENYGRAAGMMSLAQSGSGILAPIIAGAVVVTWGLVPIFLFDIASFCIAIALLLAVRIPTPSRSQPGEEARGSLWKETVFGWRYIVARRPLLLLQLSFFASNLIAIGVHDDVDPDDPGAEWQQRDHTGHRQHGLSCRWRRRRRTHGGVGRTASQGVRRPVGHGVRFRPGDHAHGVWPNTACLAHLRFSRVTHHPISQRLQRRYLAGESAA